MRRHRWGSLPSPQPTLIHADTSKADLHIRPARLVLMSFSPAFPRMPAATPLPAPPLPGTGDRWALFLDVDGTLLEFAERPGDVRVDPELYALLAELYAYLDGALALVSGRSLVGLDALFGSPPWAMAGLHGLQLRHADGERRETRVSASRRTLVLHAAEAIARAHPGGRAENK